MADITCPVCNKVLLYGYYSSVEGTFHVLPDGHAVQCWGSSHLIGRTEKDGDQ